METKWLMQIPSPMEKNKHDVSPNRIQQKQHSIYNILAKDLLPGSTHKETLDNPKSRDSL